MHNRASFADALMKDAGVRFVLDLADTEEKILGYMEKEAGMADDMISRLKKHILE